MAPSSTLYKDARVFLLVLLACSCGAVVVPNNEPRATFSRPSSFANLCPRNCFCSPDAVHCTGWAPEQDPQRVLHLPSRTGILVLEATPVDHLNMTAGLTGMERLRWLRIHDGHLISIPTLPLLPFLTFLDLSGNRIRSLPPGGFNNTPHVVKLDLSYNDLRSVSMSAFPGFTDLDELDLSRNPLLAQVPGKLFAGAPALRFLDLSHTGLTNFSEGWSEYLQELHFLNLSYNKINLQPRLHLPTLGVLDLSHNPLLHIPQLESFPRLTKLFTSHSNISELRTTDTKGCNRLRVLVLSYSNLTNIGEEVLIHCRNLQEIDLSHNSNLVRIEHAAFSNLKNLTLLRINHCPKLYDLEEEVFNGLHGLQNLSLQESGLKVLPTSMMQLTNLTMLNLEGVVLFCNCYAHWLPEILNSRKPSWKGLDTIRCSDGVNRSASEVALHLKAQQCAKVEAYSKEDRWILASWGQSAVLECNTTGNPTPKVVWQTMDYHIHVFNKSIKDHPWVHHQISQILSQAEEGTGGKVQVLESGQLLIRNVTREDIGRYKCFAFNPVSNTSVVTFLGLDDSDFRAFILESIIFGFACAALFLFITLIVQLIQFLMDRFGWECCCCKDRLSPKAKQIWQLIESVEAYKSAQLERLKENYNSQVVSIKDSCYQQMERLRESYAQQSKNLKDLCDYSTQQITGARDQYLEQVNKVRDYSTSQMNRVRENYVFQRHRIRKFSGHQLIRLRETYKYQQKTLNKLLETLPDLYIQNCRTGSCQRTDSIVFDNEIAGLDAYYRVDFLDTQSYSSDYYTPNSTLTRQSKGGKGTHSRAPSNASGVTEYQEAQSWITRQESVSSNEKFPDNYKGHSRSFSITVPPSSALHRRDSIRTHKRSISASSHPSPQLFHPKAPLLEENGDSPPLVGSPSIETKLLSNETPLVTPLILTPIHDSVKSSLASFLHDREQPHGEIKPQKSPDPLGDSQLPHHEDTQNTQCLDCDNNSTHSDLSDNQTRPEKRQPSKSVSYETSL